jgi:hypothetical protein
LPTGAHPATRINRIRIAIKCFISTSIIVIAQINP